MRNAEAAKHESAGLPVSELVSIDTTSEKSIPSLVVTLDMRNMHEQPDVVHGNTDQPGRPPRVASSAGQPGAAPSISID